MNRPAWETLGASVAGEDMFQPPGQLRDTAAAIVGVIDAVTMAD